MELPEPLARADERLDRGFRRRGKADDEGERSPEGRAFKGGVRLRGDIVLCRDPPRQGGRGKRQGEQERGERGGCPEHPPSGRGIQPGRKAQSRGIRRVRRPCGGEHADEEEAPSGETGRERGPERGASAVRELKVVAALGEGDQDGAVLAAPERRRGAVHARFVAGNVHARRLQPARLRRVRVALQRGNQPAEPNGKALLVHLLQGVAGKLRPAEVRVAGESQRQGDRLGAARVRPEGDRPRVAEVHAESARLAAAREKVGTPHRLPAQRQDRVHPRRREIETQPVAPARLKDELRGKLRGARMGRPRAREPARRHGPCPPRGGVGDDFFSVSQRKQPHFRLRVARPEGEVARQVEERVGRLRQVHVSGQVGPKARLLRFPRGKSPAHEGRGLEGGPGRRGAPEERGYPAQPRRGEAAGHRGPGQGEDKKRARRDHEIGSLHRPVVGQACERARHWLQSEAFSAGTGRERMRKTAAAARSAAARRPPESSAPSPPREEEPKA